jgi:hypothetical protein
MLNRSILVTGFSVVLGTLGLNAIAPASAQTSSVEPFQLSEEGFEILCERSPLNSRCAGVTQTSGNQRSPQVDSPSDTTTAPTENLPSESEVPEAGEREGLRNDLTRPRINESRNQLDDTTAPTENLPSESDETAPNPDQMSPQMSPDSRDDMNTPNNTTAPTENLPSDSGVR